MSLSFLMSEHFKGLMFDFHKQANLEGQRSQECERGTQECVRHNDFNILGGLGRAGSSGT